MMNERTRAKTLHSTKHQPRKRFGQNFLSDQTVVDSIVAAIGPSATDKMIEIGPGMGVLTEPLLKRCPTLIAVEIDRDLAEVLQERFASYSGFSLRRGDALRTDFAALGSGQPMRIVGNLPYNISTPLMFHLLTYSEQIIDMHFMLQKEVVDRLTAHPGSKLYGRLSVMMQYQCKVQALLAVPSSAFTPSPKVASALVRLVPHTTRPHTARDPALFSRLVNTCFQQRRKTLRNSIKGLIQTGATMDGLDIDLTTRPEMLSVGDFVALSNQLSTR